jgi:predicted acetyltransferase
VDLDLRPIVPDELAAFKRTDAYGFGFRRNDADEVPDWAELDLDRTVAVFEGDEIVATGRNYSLDLTLPGGAIVPTAAVSWIAVRPTHRRRGILREMMTYLAEEGARRGEPASILTASEGGIYRRFGFGVATRVLGIEIDQRAVAFTDPVARGRVRMIEPDESLAIAPELFDRVRVQRNGAVSRPPAWWAVAWVEKDEIKHRFDVVYEVDGRVEGYAVYGVDGPWGPAGNDRSVTVQDLVATTPDAEAALWQYLCGVDLTQRVVHPAVPEDIELPWRLRDSRHVGTTSLRDWLWLRPLDVPALLGARRYATADRLVLEVHDGMRPDGDASGRFALDGGPDGASCSRTTDAADLVLDAAALGSISLGGISPSMLARAGEIDESRPGALGVADRLFATDRAPYNFTWF